MTDVLKGAGSHRGPGRCELRRSSATSAASASNIRGLICYFYVGSIPSKAGSGVGETVGIWDSRRRGIGCVSFVRATLHVCWRRRGGIIQYLAVIRE
jgi:hypothetical protein